MKKKHLLFMVLLCTPTFIIAFASGAEAASTDIVSQIVNQFSTLTKTWEKQLTQVATHVFYYCVVLDVALNGYKIAMNQQQMNEALKIFVMTLLGAGFYLAIISNYNTWAWNIIDGLIGVAGQLVPIKAASENPLLVGMGLIDKIWTIIAEASFWDEAGKIFGLVFAALIVLVCFALITAQIVLIKCEALVAIPAALILVGLGGTSLLRDYANNVLRYILSVGFKLFVMYLVLGIGISFIDSFKTLTTMSMGDIAVVVGAVIVVLALVKSLPEAVGGIISGSHIGGGTMLRATAGAVGSAAAGAVSATIRGAANTRDAANLAKYEGKTGFSRAKGAVGHLGSAMLDAKRGKSYGSVAAILENRKERSIEIGLGK